MRKSELTEQQANDRSAFIATLAPAGWTTTEMARRVEEGWSMPSESQFEFENNEICLRASFRASTGTIYLAIYKETFEGNRLGFIIEYGDKLAELAGLIVFFGSTITLNNYKEYLSRILDLGLEVYVDMGEEGRSPLRRE